MPSHSVASCADATIPSFDMTHLQRSLALVVSLSLSALGAACSAGTDGTGSPAAAGTQTTPTEPPPDVPPPPSKTLPMTKTVDPAIVAALKSANVDVTKPMPALDELAKSPAKLKAVMKTFTIALGTTCEGCHAKSGTQLDYRADTTNKKLTRKMWSEIVVALQRTDGSAIYCDSCHQGKMQFLDRANDRSLEAWMKSEFVGKLARRDGKANSCASCHGEPFVGGLVEEWAK